jgi:uncharacterized repeat protein (TIGR02543 family)
MKKLLLGLVLGIALISSANTAHAEVTSNSSGDVCDNIPGVQTTVPSGYAHLYTRPTFVVSNSCTPIGNDSQNNRFIIVKSPNGGETHRLNDTITVNWDSSRLGSNDNLGMYLLPAINPNNPGLIGAMNNVMINIPSSWNSVTLKLNPLLINPGEYRILLKRENPIASSNGLTLTTLWTDDIFDASDEIFTILPATGSSVGNTNSYTLTTSKSGTGSGTITGTSASYASGQTATLTAVPASGSTFAGWSGACTNRTGTCSIVMNGNKTVTANFTLILANPATAPNNSTISELQAMIASLTAQINALLAQQIPVTTPVDSINPTSSANGTITFVDRPTLKLVYDRNRSESSLEGSANVYVQAGENDLLINYMAIFIGDTNGKQVFTNKRSSEFVGVSNTTKELVPATYGSSNYAWRIKAGTKAVFKMKITENPQGMFAGTYTASLGPVGILNRAGEAVYDQLAYSNTKSLPVTIIGEKSPYISGSEFKGTNVMISGVRFSRGDKVYVNNVRKGVLTDVTILNNNLINGAFPIAWLDITPTGRGGCPVYGNIQIENEKYGKSNGYYVSKDCSGTSGPLSVKSMELIGVGIGLNTFQAGKPIKFSVKGISSDGKQAYPSSGFHVQSSIKKPSQTTTWEPVTVNGVVQSVNAEFNYSTGYWDVTMTAPSDPSGTYTVDTAFYCSMASSGCVDGSQINQSFTFKIGNPVSPSSPNMTVSARSITSGESVKLNFTWPSNTTTSFLNISCPSSISTRTSLELCNTRINVTSNSDYTLNLSNSSTQSQEVQIS